MRTREVPDHSRRRGVLASVVVVATILVGLVGLTAPLAAAQDDGFPSRIKVLHADTDSDRVEVAINYDERLDSFEYGSVSDWLEVEPGVVRFTVTEDRAGFNYLIFDAVYPVAAGTDYYVVLSDALVIGTAVERDPVSEGGARVQVLHASVDVPPIDVAVAGGDVLIEDLQYGQRSDAVEVEAGSYDLEVRIAETGEVALSLPGTTVEAGMVYQFVAMGSPGSDDHPLTVTPLIDEVRAGAATPEATPTS